MPDCCKVGNCLNIAQQDGYCGWHCGSGLTGEDIRRRMVSIDDLNGSNDPAPGDIRPDVLVQVDWENIRMRMRCDVRHDGTGEFPEAIGMDFSLLRCGKMELRMHLTPDRKFGVSELKAEMRTRPKRLVFNPEEEGDW